MGLWSKPPLYFADVWFDLYTCFKVYFPIFGVQQVFINNRVPSNGLIVKFFLGSLFAAGMYPISLLNSSDLSLKQVVSPLKDVEGLHFKFHYNLYHKYVSFLFIHAANVKQIKKPASVSSNQNPCWCQLCQLQSQRTARSRRLARSSLLFPVLLSQSSNV
jgi:hypothetical protein